MSEQLMELQKEALNKGKPFWKGDKFKANKVLTDLNYECIYDTIKGAKKGQEYIKEVVKYLDDVAVWHTPLYDFPVMQPSFKYNKYRIRTPLGRLEIRLSVNMLDKNKQASSIAANFIHSIDATILSYCVLNSEYTLGCIHDCFLVHPNNGERIRNQYKEGYVNVMKSDPLLKFSKEVDTEAIVEIPYVNDLDLDEVFESKYIIS